MYKNDMSIKWVSKVPEGYVKIKDIAKEFDMSERIVYGILYKIESLPAVKYKKVLYYSPEALDYIKERQLFNAKVSTLYSKEDLAKKLNVSLSLLTYLLITNNVAVSMEGFHKKAYYDNNVLIKMHYYLKEYEKLQATLKDCYTFENLRDLMQITRAELTLAFFQLKLKSTYKIKGIAYYNADIMYKIYRFLVSKEV